jgi:Calcineurin-like phosphoesterase
VKGWAVAKRVLRLHQEFVVAYIREMRQRFLASVILLALSSAFIFGQTASPATSSGPWTFAVSGDSRNCGDIVMPMIAQSALQHSPRFYWHLGDLRAIYDMDEDIRMRPEYQPGGAKGPIALATYVAGAWPDFIENQIKPWGAVPFMVGIGNHETVAPMKDRQDFLIQFADWLNAPVIQQQRLKDNPADHALKAYYHWIQGGVDFIYLDNATWDQFDFTQLAWLKRTLANAEKNTDVTAVVVGMHAALPDSLASGHSMNDWGTGEKSGREAYNALLDFRSRTGKPVYVLASHSHFLMANIFNSDYWKSHGGVLPGWIVGTAGAFRYKLPPTANLADQAMTNVYGYLLATVNPSKPAAERITFDFVKVERKDLPQTIADRMGPTLVDYCFNKNSEVPGQK